MIVERQICIENIAEILILPSNEMHLSKTGKLKLDRFGFPRTLEYHRQSSTFRITKMHDSFIIYKSSILKAE